MSLGCGRISASDGGELRRRSRDAGAVAQRQEAQDLGSWQCGFESHRPHQIGHCTNTGHLAAGLGMFCVRGLRDAEHGNDVAWTGDLDLCDQRFDERFALAVRAGGDDLVDVIGDLDERGGRRHHRFCIELAGEFVAAGRELPGPGLERGEAAGEVFGVQGAVLERGQVAVDRRAGSGQLVLGPGQFGAPALGAAA
jgi:hypothetical protein